MSGVPRVSVVVPTFNRSHRLVPTLRSVLDQSFSDLELLVVDDGSTDDTPAVAEGISDPRLRLLRQSNAGGAAARRHGLEAARGELVAFLDHDDRWKPQKLERQLARLDEAGGEFGLVYGRLVYLDEDGSTGAEISLPQFEGQVFQQLLVHHNFLFSMSNPLMRTDLVREVGGPDPSALLSDDWDLFLKLARVTRFAFADEVLVEYNVGNPNAQTRHVFRVYESERNLLDRWLLPSREVDGQVRREAESAFRGRFAPAFRERAWHALRAGDRKLAWRCYRLAFRLHPGYLRDPGVMRDVASLCLLSTGLRRAVSP